MTDFVLDTTTHDLTLRDNDILLFENNQPLTVQRVKINLLNYRGEWFRDINTGVPYLQTIFGVRNSKSAADAVIRTTITETENIAYLTSYSSTVTTDRRLVITFSAVMESGGAIEDITLEI